MGKEGWGEAKSLRHFPASESHGGDAGWSPNRRSSGKSPRPSRKEGLKGTEEATLRGRRRRGGGGAHMGWGRGRPRLLVLDSEIVDRAGDGSLWLAEACERFLLPPDGVAED